MLNYAAVKVSDLERSGAFYDSILAPLGWRRQEAPANSVSWGLIKAEFYIELSDTQRPGLNPDVSGLTGGVTDGTRTRNIQNHNLGLYH